MTAEAIERQFVICECHKKQGCYCKNWNGKGTDAAVIALIKTSCEKDPETCPFLVESKKREECEWVWQTESGNPANFRPPEPKEPEPKPLPKKTCIDCKKIATHLIKGYKPSPVCEEHAKQAEENGFEVVVIPERN